MKVKNFLGLLVAVLFIFFSCEDKNKDYRNGFIGTYATDIVGSINLVEIGLSMPMEFVNEDIVVEKLGSKELKLTHNASGENKSTIVIVDEDGDFTLPAESVTETEIDPETGIKLTMNITTTGTGTITKKTLYINEKWSGIATLELDGEKLKSSISGTVVYNGKKR